MNKINISFLLGAVFAIGFGYLYWQWRLDQNDRLASLKIKSLSGAVEQYLKNHDGQAPVESKDLSNYYDKNVKTPFCGEVDSGYIFECEFGFENSYSVTARAQKFNITGRKSMTISKSKQVLYGDPSRSPNVRNENIKYLGGDDLGSVFQKGGRLRNMTDANKDNDY